MIAHGIDLDTPAAREFCRKCKIREPCVFDSILRDEFEPDSDVDFLFDLEPGVTLTMDSWIAMEEDLHSIIGRSADLWIAMIRGCSTC